MLTPCEGHGVSSLQWHQELGVAEQMSDVLFPNRKVMFPLTHGLLSGRLYLSKGVYHENVQHPRL